MKISRSSLSILFGAGLIALGLLSPESAGAKDVNVYMGNYGYLLEYPSGFTALPSFADPEKTMETVLFFPKERLRAA